MTYSNIVMLASSAFIALIVISSAAPLIEQQQKQQQPSNQNSQISNEFMPDMFADYNRYFMKTKKWSPASAAAAAGPQMGAFNNVEEPESKWAHVRSFFPDKRMDENLDYPNLNSGRLEWNFNRL